VFPLINTAVELRAPDGSVIPAMIAFVTDAYAAVERPADHPEEDVPDGALYDLMWPASNGVNIQPVKVIERPGRNRTTIWEAAEAGEYRLEQRRAFVRVAVTVPVTIADLDAEDDREPQEAELVDVSEAALRCSVEGGRWAEIENGSRAAVVFLLGETPFSSQGTVLRTRHTPDDPAVEVIVMFDEDPSFAAGLRRAVFAEQRRILAEERAAEELFAADRPEHDPEVPSSRQRKWWQLR
jgi:hypothetical protein